MFTGRIETFVLSWNDIALFSDERGTWVATAQSATSHVGIGARPEEAIGALFEKLEADMELTQNTGTSNQGADLGALSTLSPRQREVLVLTAEGKDPREVAAQMGVSPKTVESFINGINKKLGTKSRLQAVVMYYQARLRNMGATSDDVR